MISLTQAIELVMDSGCEDLETFTELVNAEYARRYDEDDLSELWKQTKAEIEGEDPDLPDDTR